jgi:hypothetical protein
MATNHYLLWGGDTRLAGVTLKLLVTRQGNFVNKAKNLAGLRADLRVKIRFIVSARLLRKFLG